MSNGPVKIESKTVQIWGFIIATIAVIMAISKFGLTMPFSEVGFLNSMFLILLSLTIFTELGLKKALKKKNPLVAIELLVGIVAIILAFSVLGFVTIPTVLQGVIGVFYIFLAIFTVAELFR